MFNIPTTFTQGDLVTWKEQLEGYNPATDTLSCFIRGQNGALDLTATPSGESWEFNIPEVSYATLVPGAYKAQFVIFATDQGRQTLGITDLLVCPSFENLTEFDVRDADEIELEAITKAIATLAKGGVAEYYIGDRRVRYQDLSELTKRQQYLRNRIAKKKQRSSLSCRHVGIRFCD